MNAGAFQVFDCELDGTRLIEASAGTGKTWNLCALYLRLLLERDLKVEDILVVTFTNAATAELRERIRSRIAETLARLRGTAPPSADPFVGELLDRLRGSIEHKTMDTRLELALQSFDEASILTIHGFCQRALAEAPFSTGMPMQLTLLADDSEMRLDVVHDFWRRRIAGAQLPPALAAHLLEHKFTPQRLAELLARRLGKPLAQQRWPQALDAPVSAPDDAALAAAFNAARTLWRADRDEIIALLREAQPRLHKAHYADGPLQQALQSWDRLLAGPAVPDSLAGLDKLDLLGSARLRPNKGLAPPTPHDFFGAAQALLDLLAARSQALELQRLQLLRELLDEGPAALRRAKRDQRVLAFDDMLFNLHQRLAAPDGAVLARRLRQRFAAALIDEFQDTDPLQYAIFRAIYARQRRAAVPGGRPEAGDLQLPQRRPAHLPARARRRPRRIHAGREPALHAAVAGRAERAVRRQSARLHAGGPGLHAGALRAEAAHAAAGSAAAAARALQLWQLPRDAAGQPLAKAEAMRLSLQACAAEIARLLAQRCDGSAIARWRPATSRCWCAAMRRARRCAGRWRRWAWAASSCRRPASSTAPMPRTWNACCRRCCSRSASHCCVPRWPPRRWASTRWRCRRCRPTKHRCWTPSPASAATATAG